MHGIHKKKLKKRKRKRKRRRRRTRKRKDYTFRCQFSTVAWNMASVCKDTGMTSMYGLLGLNSQSSIVTTAQIDESCGDLHGFKHSLSLKFSQL